MNKVILTGAYLGRDVDLKTSGETTIAKFSVAVNRKFSKDGQSDWINIVAFGKTAEFCSKYFHKGSRINLVGRIQSGSYTNKDGQTVYTTDVIAEEVEFGQSKKEQESESSNTSQEAPQETSNKPDDGFMNVPDELDSELPFA